MGFLPHCADRDQFALNIAMLIHVCYSIDQSSL